MIATFILGALLLATLGVIVYLVRVLVASQQSMITKISTSVETVIKQGQEQIEKILASHSQERDKIIDLALFDQRLKEAQLDMARERHSARTEIMKENSKNQMSQRNEDKELEFDMAPYGGRGQLLRQYHQRQASASPVIRDSEHAYDDSGTEGLAGDVG